MAWIEAHDSLKDARTTRRLARHVGGVGPAYGYITVFWLWCLEQAPDGQLGACDAEDIAFGAGWDGDPYEFVEWFVEAGLLSCIDGRFAVPYWWDLPPGRTILSRAESAVRQAGHRDGRGPLSDDERLAAVRARIGAMAQAASARRGLASSPPAPPGLPAPSDDDDGDEDDYEDDVESGGDDFDPDF